MISSNDRKASCLLFSRENRPKSREFVGNRRWIVLGAGRRYRLQFNGRQAVVGTGLVELPLRQAYLKP